MVAVVCLRFCSTRSPEDDRFGRHMSLGIIWKFDTKC